MICIMTEKKECTYNKLDINIYLRSRICKDLLDSLQLDLSQIDLEQMDLT